MPDNPLDQEETPNPVAHVHHYVLRGSGGSHYAECRELVIENGLGILVNGVPVGNIKQVYCAHKLAGDNGPIVGSRQKVLEAIAASAPSGIEDR